MQIRILYIYCADRYKIIFMKEWNMQKLHFKNRYIYKIDPLLYIKNKINANDKINQKQIKCKMNLNLKDCSDMMITDLLGFIVFEIQP